MISISAQRALARVELRQLLRHVARSWLVVLLIAVPVAAMVGGSALFEITQRTPDEQRAQVLGRAALRIDDRVGHGLERIRAALPPEARVEGVCLGREAVRVPGRRLAARSFALDARTLEARGLAAGMLRITHGRAPTSAGEVALSAVLLQGLARSIGGTVTLESGPAHITGIVVDPENLDMPVVMHGPHPPQPGRAHAWLVDLPGGQVESVAARLRAAGHRVTSRADLGQRDEFEATAIFVLGGFGFFEAALVIAAAFAVSLRRRQREIGLLGANGASLGDMRTSLVASAFVLACVGAIIGVASGSGVAAALHPFLDGWNRRSNGEFELSPKHVLGAVLLGLVTAVAAAAVPARSATRLPIRIALSGRRPLAEVPRAWPLVGLALVTGGFGFMLWGARSQGAAAAIGILGGSILGVLGLGACSPWLLDLLARFAGPLPLAWRLAVRDAGRFRARNGPVVTAVLAGMSVSVMLAALLGSVESMLHVAPAAMRDDQLLVDGPGAEEVAGRLSQKSGCVARAPLTAAYSQGEIVHARFGGGEHGRPADAWVAVGTDDLLRALDADAAISSMRAGRVVALVDPSEGNKATVEAPSVELVVGTDRTIARTAVTFIETTQRVRSPVFVVGEDSLAGLALEAGLPPQASLVPWIVRLDSPVTEDVLERVRDLAVETSGAAAMSVDAAILHIEPAGVFFQLVLLFCFVTGLIVVLVATALSSVESVADARVLFIVGAAPSLLRMHVAARAGYLALLGCVLAVPAGLIPSYGLLSLANVALEFSMPWTEVLIVAFGLPAIAFGAAWMFAALRRAATEASPSTS